MCFNQSPILFVPVIHLLSSPIFLSNLMYSLIKILILLNGAYMHMEAGHLPKPG